MRRGLSWALSGVLGLGCATSGAGRQSAPGAKHGDTALNDDSRCEYKGRTDREVSESVGNGALQPSIRRVYRLVGEGAQRRRILICREVDTNLDGRKDIVRRYNDQGEVIEEDADSNYDGKIDTWVHYSKGRISRVDVDLDGDDTPDETRYYVQGKLSRVQRDTNHDGRPDVWEIYSAGHLERMGIDVDHDGRVDRWNRDEVVVHQAAAAEGETSAASNSGSSSGSEPAGDIAQGSVPGAPAGSGAPGAAAPGAKPAPGTTAPSSRGAAPPDPPPRSKRRH